MVKLEPEIGAMEKEEVGLDLDLSIGGSFCRAEKKLMEVMIGDLLGDSKECVVRSSSPPSLISDGENVSLTVEIKKKSKIQALRRQEVKRKREEKQNKTRGIIRGRRLENETGEKEEEEERVFKQEKTERTKSERVEMKKLDLNVSYEQETARGSGFPDSSAGENEKKNEFLPVAWRSFRPLGNQNSRINLWKDYGRRDNGDRKIVSSESPECSSSVVSDDQCSLQEGSGSDVNQSHSSQSLSHHRRSNGSEAGLNKEPRPKKNRISNSTSDNSTSTESKGTTPTVVKDRKPPKPQRQINRNDNDKVCLPQMPCVSTTGNGPNGKTIRGLLYRYSKLSEVTIVCVCHGKALTPAEFVQHAGSTDVSHPLRQIIMIPSHFA